MTKEYSIQSKIKKICYFFVSILYILINGVSVLVKNMQIWFRVKAILDTNNLCQPLCTIMKFEHNKIEN